MFISVWVVPSIDILYAAADFAFGVAFFNVFAFVDFFSGTANTDF